jgi:hypothetical protein
MDCNDALSGCRTRAIGVATADALALSVLFGLLVILL